MAILESPGAPLAPSAPTAVPAARRDAPGRTAARRLWIDRFARFVVTGGGLAIIASILGILLFILLEVVPLVRAPRVEAAGSMALDRKVNALVTDPYQALVATAAPDGKVRVQRL